MATYAVYQSPLQRPDHFPHVHTQSRSSQTSQTKPKLSLTTIPCRSYGRASTGLRLDTLSGTSPTRSNTYRNCYDLKLKSHQKEQVESHATHHTHDNHSTASDSASDDSDEAVLCSTPSTEELEEPTNVPYSCPSQTCSILINGPYTKRRRSRRSSPESPSAAHNHDCSTSTLKKVCFRDPLYEEIQNTQYLLAHADIRSRSISPAPKTECARETTTLCEPLPPKAREVAPTCRNHHDEESDDSSDDENSSIPKTPVAGRNEHDREWFWTLGPLPGVKEPGSYVPSEASEEDLDDSLGESVAAALGFTLQESTPTDY